tara:strand:+ start:9953 stop:10525 length:573 start_codon:yes stop_codon:yes gene_type:complete
MKYWGNYKMSLYISEIDRTALERTNMGKEVLQQLSRTEDKYMELLKYGRARVLSVLEVNLYTKIKKQEDITCNNLKEYLIRPKLLATKDTLIASLKALYKGYDIVIAKALESGLERIDVDFFAITKPNGDEIMVVPDRNTKAVLELEYQGKSVLIYTMQELCTLISSDDMQYEMKKNFQATIQEPEDIPF